MKNQAYLTLSLTFLGSISSSFAQSGKEVRNRIEGTDRPSVPSLTTGAQSGNENTSAEATSSDTGAQRPIQLKKKGVSLTLDMIVNIFIVQIHSPQTVL